MAGRLRLVEADAAWLVLAVGTGVTLALLASGEAPLEQLAARLAREPVLVAIAIAIAIAIDAPGSSTPIPRTSGRR